MRRSTRVETDSAVSASVAARIQPAWFGTRSSRRSRRKVWRVYPAWWGYTPAVRDSLQRLYEQPFQDPLQGLEPIGSGCGSPGIAQAQYVEGALGLGLEPEGRRVGARPGRRGPEPRPAARPHPRRELRAAARRPPRRRSRSPAAGEAPGAPMGRAWSPGRRSRGLPGGPSAGTARAVPTRPRDPPPRANPLTRPTPRAARPRVSQPLQGRGRGPWSSRVAPFSGVLRLEQRRRGETAWAAGRSLQVAIMGSPSAPGGEQGPCPGGGRS